MSPLQRLLLVPLLSPLLAVLLTAAINQRPAVTVRLLTWISPALPLGAWMGGGAAAGAALSAAATGLALRGASGELQERRQVRRRREEADRPEAEPRQPEQGGWMPSWAGPTRAAADPPPTVTVPFRVIRKGRPDGGAAASAEARVRATTVSTGDAAAGSDGDGWDDATTDEW